MTRETGEALRGAAVDWHVRIADGGVETWEAFTLWLEADPAHANAYDAVAALDDEAGAAVAAALLPPPALHAANDAGPPVRRRWLAGGGAIAAMVALAVTLGPRVWPGRDLYRVESAPGVVRSIVLASGDTITLNGGSSVMLDRKNLRYASLERGEAAFGITHDASAPFMVEAGDERIQDVGTVFNVARGDDGVRVAVAEGSVVYNPGREAVRLRAGEALRDPGGTAPVVLARVDPSGVAAWRKGRLSYADAPFSLIASDLARATGFAVHVAPSLAGRQFSGTIRLGADRAALMADVARLLDVEARHGPDGWTLAPRPRAAP